MGFKPEHYSAREAEDMKKRVLDLDKESTRNLKDTDGKLIYRESAHGIAEKEDKMRERLKKSNLSAEEINEFGDDKSTDALIIEETQRRALTDSLTGLWNREALKKIVLPILKAERRVVESTEGKKSSVHSLIILDLDHFKRVNDTYGHLTGDKVLKEVAEAIKGALREGVAYRYGGEEIAIFLPRTGGEAAKRVSERIKQSIENLEIESSDGRKIKITASLGYSTTEQIPEETTKEKLLDAMVENSDAASYFSKGKGRNRVTTYNEEVMKYKIVSDLWNESEKNQAVQRLKEGKNCQEAIGNISNISEAFKKHAMSCGCSDGRIHEHRIGRPGQGILAGVEATVDYIGKMIEEGKIKDKFEITSHSGCGAAEMLYKILKEKGEVPSEVATHDDLGIKFAKDILKSAKERFKNIEFTYRHIKGDEMEKIHNERAIYFDGTEKINIKAVSELPDGFTFTHMPEIDRRKTEEELEALCGIALGHHGFGERFTKEKPFWIIVSAKDEEQLGELRSIAESVAQKFEKRVKVDGFIVKG